ncbi:MAG: 3-methyl-2-oxobutanoate hydroxymethyltransferase [Gemmatimonadota bacterium]
MSSAPSPKAPRVTTRTLRDMKDRGEKIAVLTCYDHLFGSLLDQTAVDVVLVGDSLGQVILGYDSTLPVTLDEMIHHSRAVRRAISQALLVVDLPFLSYQISDEDALRNAGRVLKETGAEAVKLEGGDASTLSRVRALVNAGIPVMGHLGLTPQALHRFGGYRVQGRGAEQADIIKNAAAGLAEAGCFSFVLELVPSELAGEITRAVDIPTIGIGAGSACDGQVLVLPDMLGLNPGFTPKFLRRFGSLAEEVGSAVDTYIRAVKDGDYPSDEESYGD